jgi:hypothetical protein
LLPQGDFYQFYESLEKKFHSIKEIQPFRVMANPLHWMWGSGDAPLPEDILNQLTFEKVRAIQSHARPDFTWARDCKIYRMETVDPQRDGKSHIRFISVLTLPGSRKPTITNNPYVHEIVRLCNKWSQDDIIIRPSVYLGVGCGQILIRGEVLRYYSIADFLTEVAAETATAEGFTRTYLVADADPFVCDNVSDRAIARMQDFQKDPLVNSVFPDLYEIISADPARLREIERFVRDTLVNMEESRRLLLMRLLRGPLCALARNDESDCASEMLSVFRKSEKRLREHLNNFIGRVLGREKIGLIRDEAGLAAKKHHALGDLWGAYVATIRHAPDLAAEHPDLLKGGVDFAELRNRIAHGEDIPLNNWQKWMADFVQFGLHSAKLEELIEQLLATNFPEIHRDE